jgi:V8-like Glu-specific endopeptidase
MQNQLNFEAEPFEAYPMNAETLELSEEMAVASHPTLGPGRRVPRRSIIGEIEAPPRVYHAALGPGRRVPRSSAAPEADAGELELIGADERQLVSDTLQVPFRWICSLELFFNDPDDPASYLEFVGSGTLVGPRHVLTAGHCLFDRITGSSGTSGVLEVAVVRVTPGRNGSGRQLGFSMSATVRYSGPWKATRDARFDYGLITLRDNLGAKPAAGLGGRALGFWGSPTHGAASHITPMSQQGLTGKPVNISGYPADKPSGTQWRSYGHVTNVNPQAGNQLIYYDLDTCGGHSGSPVWLRSQQSRNLIAIHTGPCIPGGDCTALPGSTCFPGGQRYSSNRGVRVTTDLWHQVREWIGGAVVPPTASRPTLRRGSQGPAVTELQTRLNTWLMRTPSAGLPLIIVDGAFGSKTDGAVRAFQRAMNLQVDGVVGPQTWGALLSLS